MINKFNKILLITFLVNSLYMCAHSEPANHLSYDERIKIEVDRRLKRNKELEDEISNKQRNNMEEAEKKIDAQNKYNNRVQAVSAGVGLGTLGLGAYSLYKNKQEKSALEKKVEQAIENAATNVAEGLAGGLVVTAKAATTIPGAKEALCAKLGLALPGCNFTTGLTLGGKVILGGAALQAVAVVAVVGGVCYGLYKLDEYMTSEPKEKNNAPMI